MRPCYTLIVASRSRVPVWLVIGAPVTIVLGVGILDLRTDPNFAYSSLYVLPVLIASWRGPRGWGMALAAVGAAVWTLAHVPHLPESAPRFLSAWNFGMRLSTLVLVAWLVGALRAQLSLAERNSRTDVLTGLATRRWFFTRLVEEVERARRYLHPVTIAFIDVDDFKAVNDTFGHQAGDRLLHCIARTMQHHIRDVDLAGRLGGDEFMLLLPETGPKHARATIERLSEALRSATRSDGHPVTFSIGVLTLKRAPDDPSAAMRTADELMYEVKQQGKNGVVQRVIE